jgi:hypothetical protein
VGTHTREVVARFEAKQQALAVMDHPNIAKVLDAVAAGACSPTQVSAVPKVPSTLSLTRSLSVPRRNGCCVCRRCAAAFGHRYLRGDVALRAIAHEGHRHPHGAGRRPDGVLGSVVGQGTRLVTVGVVVGIAGAAMPTSSWRVSCSG